MGCTSNRTNVSTVIIIVVVIRMKTRYVISYRGSEAYVCSYDRNTGEVIYTPQIENAYKFDSLIEARLEIFNLVRPEEYYVVTV